MFRIQQRLFQHALEDRGCSGQDELDNPGYYQLMTFHTFASATSLKVLTRKTGLAQCTASILRSVANSR